MENQVNAQWGLRPGVLSPIYWSHSVTWWRGLFTPHEQSSCPGILVFLHPSPGKTWHWCIVEIRHGVMSPKPVCSPHLKSRGLGVVVIQSMRQGANSSGISDLAVLARPLDWACYPLLWGHNPSPSFIRGAHELPLPLQKLRGLSWF